MDSCPVTGLKWPRGWVGIELYSFLTSALEGGGWSAPRPGRFTPGKDPVPIVQEGVWPQDRSGCVRKISPPPGFDPRTVQPVVSRYTDWATRPINNNLLRLNVDAFLSFLRPSALSQKTPRLVMLSAIFSLNINLAISSHKNTSNSSDLFSFWCCGLTRAMAS
jgi:hypothetical protein